MKQIAQNYKTGELALVDASSRPAAQAACSCAPSTR